MILKWGKIPNFITRLGWNLRGKLKFGHTCFSSLVLTPIGITDGKREKNLLDTTKNKNKSQLKRKQASDQNLEGNVESTAIDLITPTNPLANPLSPEDQIKDLQTPGVDLGNSMKVWDTHNSTTPDNKSQTSSPMPKSRPVS